ncbi:MAG: hypothetical protein KBC62_01270 [Candidatus Pacebacteria bacterium]|nr:hypothetical protein [Candidatus Paceibacterota bacterium]MBP9842613.1 hypothetical protein [Candidatus Paceibacterota bacterium]
MPYFIAVLALIVVSVGFTLFKSPIEVGQTTTEPTSTEFVNEAVNALTATNTPQTNTEEAVETVRVVSKTEEPTSQPESTIVPVTPKSTTPTPVPSPTPTPVITTEYRNGTYNTQTSYRTPDGTYRMDVSLTIANDKITSTNLSFDSKGARDGYSKRFSNSYQGQLIGQDLGDVNLSRVGGASLTTKAFNTAIDSIRSQATS